MPTLQCMYYGHQLGVAVDLLAYGKYILGWIYRRRRCSALGFFLSESVGGPAAILVQVVIWIVSISAGGTKLVGTVGWNLIPRFNNDQSTDVWLSVYGQMVKNRLLYAGLALALMAGTMVIYHMKRKGVLGGRGRILSIEKEYFKNHYAGHFTAGVLFCLFAPVIVGLEALNQSQAGQVLDIYFSLLGIVLLTPPFMPEQNKDIRDLLASKEYPVRNVQLLRLLQAYLILAVLNLLVLFQMRLGACTFPFGTYFLCAMASCVFLGGLGILAYGITDNLGNRFILIPVFYYICCYGSRESIWGNFICFLSWRERWRIRYGLVQQALC